MFPIERITLRAQAFTILGVSPAASLDEIRQAHRKLTVDRQPDRASELARITEAYRYICENAEELGVPEGPQPANTPTEPRRMSRPNLQPEETRFDDATLAECRALLEVDGGPGELHVATRLYRRGRSLTYFVDAPMAKGRNEVALPTGMLADSRRVLPRIVAFDSRETSGARYDMPAETCAEHFPGARTFSIRFVPA